MDRLEYESLVTPEEAIKLAGFRTIKDIYIANEIAEAYTTLGDVKELPWLFGTIWNTGRMQGIREERKKKVNIERKRKPEKAKRDKQGISPHSRTV